jgi:hypothetical protein
VGGYPTHPYVHTEADTIDKIEIKDLYEYAAIIARCALRILNIPKETWPTICYPKSKIQELLEKIR